MKQAMKRLLLPSPATRVLPFGIARGLRMHIDFRYQTRMYLGLYEIELNRHLRRLLCPGVVAFDVGGQHGYDAIVIAQHTRAAVVSFECDTKCVKLMLETLRANPTIASLVTTVHGTVGDDVSHIGLDDYAYAHGCMPRLIKIDIEGAELAALRSAKQLLHEQHPALIVEVHSAQLERDCGRLLMDSGYRPIVVDQRRVWPDHRPTADVNRWLVAPGR